MRLKRSTLSIYGFRDKRKTFLKSHELKYHIIIILRMSHGKHRILNLTTKLKV